MGLCPSSNWAYGLYVVFGSFPSTIAPQNSIASSTVENGVLIEPWGFHMFWECSQVGTSFCLLYTHFWHFATLHLMPSTVVCPPRYRVRWRSKRVVNSSRISSRNFVAYLSPLYKGDGGDHFFPFYQSSLTFKEAVRCALLPIFISAF